MCTSPIWYVLAFGTCVIWNAFHGLLYIKYSEKSGGQKCKPFRSGRRQLRHIRMYGFKTHPINQVNWPFAGQHPKTNTHCPIWKFAHGNVAQQAVVHEQNGEAKSNTRYWKTLAGGIDHSPFPKPMTLEECCQQWVNGGEGLTLA